jgi:hypothetical protein
MEQSSSLKWYYRNKKRILEQKKEYYQKTKEQRILANAEYRKANAEKVKEAYRRYRLKNTAKINANVRKRKAAKKHRTPKWLTEIDFERMENEYKLAAILTKLTGKKWEVDHIIPLQGANVSGLHVPSNLRAIPAFENRSKHNRFN